MKKSTWWIAAIVIIAIIIVIISANTKTSETSPLKIGFIGALSGGAATYGEATKGGVEIAVKRINEAGGVNGNKVEAIYEDGKCNGKDAATAAQKLISIDKVKFIIGLPCSGEVLSSAPITESNKVILMVSGSSPDITHAGRYIFRLFPSDIMSAQMIAEIAVSKGHKTAAIVTENTEYATALDKAFTAAYEKLGGKILVSEKHEKDATDFRSILSKIKPMNPDMLFINPQTGPTAARVAKQARDLGIKSQFYGYFFSGDEFVKSGAAVNGTLLVDVPTLDSENQLANSVLKEYQDLYGKTSQYPFFTGASYDQTNILIETIKKVGLDADALAESFYKTPSFSGAIGTYRFDENGDVVGVPLRLLQIFDNNLVLIK